MKSAWYKNKWVIILFHVTAWVILFSLPALLRPSYNEVEATKQAARNSFDRILVGRIMDLSWIGFFYLNALVLVPRLVYKKRYWQYALLQLLLLGWLVTEAGFLFQVLDKPDHRFQPGPFILFNFFIFLFMLASSTAYTLIRDKIKADNLYQEKQNANLKTELSLLRSQVSPHFMFNILNNMVSLARKKSELLEPSLIKLSSLMRYMLYETDEEKVSLERETDYLQSFIDLQQQRFGKKVIVNVNMQDIDGAYQLEPMLLIPFVENAFKHGTGLIQNARIDIELRVRQTILSFTVSNKYRPDDQTIKDQTSGIGLPNVMRRLSLLYGKNHTLTISKNADMFIVSLQLQLTT